MISSSCFPWLMISSCCLNKPCLLLGLLWTHPMILSLSLFLVQSIWSPLVTLHLLSQTLCWGQNGNFSSLRLLFASIAIDISWSATHSSPSHCCRHWRKLREYLTSPTLISREWQPTITATRFRRSIYIFPGCADGPLASPRPLRLASLAAGGAHTVHLLNTCAAATVVPSWCQDRCLKVYRCTAVPFAGWWIFFAIRGVIQLWSSATKTKQKRGNWVHKSLETNDNTR